GLARTVEGAGLVRVFAVAQGLGQRTAYRLAGRGGVADLLREPAGDGGVIGGGAGEGAGGEAFAQLEGGGAVGLEGVDHLVQPGLVDADGDVAVVLGGRADHGRAADVDVLDRRLEATAGGHGGLERIQVDPG